MKTGWVRKALVRARLDWERLLRGIAVEDGVFAGAESLPDRFDDAFGGGLVKRDADLGWAGCASEVDAAGDGAGVDGFCLGLAGEGDGDGVEVEAR